jgi:hypothetical protein
VQPREAATGVEQALVAEPERGIAVELPGHLLAALQVDVAARPELDRLADGRRELPAEIQPLVPQRGVYLAGGGEKSEVFRVVIDTDAKTIYSGKGPAASPLHGTLPDGRTRELTPRNEEHLMRLCADAWGEPAAAAAPDAVEGYDEFFIVADGDRLFFRQGHGPIKQPKAIKAIEALRAAAAL